MGGRHNKGQEGALTVGKAETKTWKGSADRGAGTSAPAGNIGRVKAWNIPGPPEGLSDVPLAPSSFLSFRHSKMGRSLRQTQGLRNQAVVPTLEALFVDAPALHK